MKKNNLKIYGLAALITISSFTLSGCKEESVMYDYNVTVENNIDYKFQNPNMTGDIVKISENYEQLLMMEKELNEKEVYLIKVTEFMRKVEYKMRKQSNTLPRSGFDEEIVVDGEGIWITSWYPTEYKEKRAELKPAKYYYRGCNINADGTVVFGDIKESISEITDEYISTNWFKVILTEEIYQNYLETGELLTSNYKNIVVK